MLNEDRLQRYADVLLWGLKTARTREFRENDVVLIKFHPPALRLAEILYSRILETGMNPVYRMVSTPFMEKEFFAKSNENQLTFRPPGEAEFLSSLNGSIFLNAPESITHLSGVDPEKIGKSILSQKYARDILDRRESEGLLSWTLCIFPTVALAEAAGVEPEVYCDQIAKACFLDCPDPVSKWREVFENAAEIKEWLNSLDVESLHVESETVDLKIGLGDRRKWIGVSGRNIPSFEIFTSPDWRRVDGVYYADQPSYRNGNYVKGAKLFFVKGKLVRASSEEGEEFLKKQLSMDQGASRIGEFSLTDRRFSKIDRFMANTLYDENYGGLHGNCHLAMGNSYETTFAGDRALFGASEKKELGFNESALHWDLVNTQEKRVTARLSSGKPVVVYENGQFAH